MKEKIIVLHLTKFEGQNVPSRVRNFVWMIAIDRVPTKEFLGRRGVHLQIIGVGLFLVRQ